MMRSKPIIKPPRWPYQVQITIEMRGAMSPAQQKPMAIAARKAGRELADIAKNNGIKDFSFAVYSDDFFYGEREL